LFGRQGGGIRRLDAVIPEAALFDAGDVNQRVAAHAQFSEGRLEPLPDLFTGYGVRGVDGGHRLDDNVVKQHEVLSWPRTPGRWLMDRSYRHNKPSPGRPRPGKN